MLTEITGDLFATTAPLIAHGVNCRGAFGAGVAGQIAKRFPEAKAAYLRKFAAGDWKPGDVQIVPCKDGLLIANLATQDRFGRPGPGVQPFATLDSIDRAVRHLFTCCMASPDLIAMPRIGCGLGGLDWSDVRPIIERAAEDYGIDVEVYSL